MDTLELKNLVVETLKSWQVIGVTVVVFIYWALVVKAGRIAKAKPKVKALKPGKAKRPPGPGTGTPKNVDDSALDLGE